VLGHDCITSCAAAGDSSAVRRRLRGAMDAGSGEYA